MSSVSLQFSVVVGAPARTERLTRVVQKISNVVSERVKRSMSVSRSLLHDSRCEVVVGVGGSGC
jgi:hypothetical protein